VQVVRQGTKGTENIIGVIENKTIAIWQGLI
jgi:hypothetical protein